ncbi:MAG: hypothetical protein NVSMB32_10090 [Actinomycetota bacterium]
MQTIAVLALVLVGIFLAVILVLTILVARNLRAVAIAVAQASDLVEAVEGQGGLPLTKPFTPTRHSMKEIFAALPSLLRRADTLRSDQLRADPSRPREAGRDS